MKKYSLILLIPSSVLIVECVSRRNNPQPTNEINEQVTQVNRPPQFVALAFDGSYSIPFWKESRAFAQDKPIKFTYFISCVYFINSKNGDAKKYLSPSGAGKSAIGFGGTDEEILERIKQVQIAEQAGHEIQSHVCGHFEGAKWSKDQWVRELDQFASFMNKSGEKIGYTLHPMTGIRAPLLSVGEGFYDAIGEKKYVYDTSRSAPANYWPEEKRFGIWNFPLAEIIIQGTGKKTLSMDYNFYYADSKGTKDPSQANQKIYEERMFNSYMKYFNMNYYGNRAPIHIGHHFSPWNGGAYWRAMQRFAQAVCAKNEVKCSTYSELADFVKNNKKNISAYQGQKFPKYVDNTSLGLAPEELDITSVSPADACVVGNEGCVQSIEERGYVVPHQHDEEGQE